MDGGAWKERPYYYTNLAVKKRCFSHLHKKRGSPAGKDGNDYTLKGIIINAEFWGEGNWWT
jgi:hypothetical protein